MSSDEIIHNHHLARLREQRFAHADDDDFSKALTSFCVLLQHRTGKIDTHSLHDLKSKGK